MQKPKVSVVIPNYNSEDYIHRCIDSLLNQSFKDFELIIIDDGSTDNSGMIADHYASTHSCVKVIHQANSGVSAARQVGLTAARGKYVTFVDPDDWVEPDMLQCLVGKAEQEDVDILFCDFFIDFSPSSREIGLQKPPSSQLKTLREMVKGNLHGSTCNKLYRLSIISNRNITFPDNISFCEDLWFNCKLLMSGDLRISYLNKAFYHYDRYSNVNSLTRKFKEKALDDYLAYIGYIFDNVQDNDDMFYTLKFNAKIFAFRSDCEQQKYYSLYPDLQSRFKATIWHSNNSKIQKIANYIALCGFLKTGRFLDSAYEKSRLPLLKRRLQKQ